MSPDTSLPPTVAEIDLTAFAHNIQMVRACLPPTCQILVVVKADAYGHGAVPLSRVAQQQGVAYLGVARCSEGVTLRQQGITAPILVLGPTWLEEVETLVAHRLTPSISSSREAMAVQHEARKHGLSYTIHINIDTGMHRFGMAADKVRNFLAEMSAWPNLSIAGLMSHLATADTLEAHVVQQQLDTFTRVQHAFAAQGITPQYVHMANSAGLCRYPASHGTLVRPGIILYGSCPFAVLEALPVRPVLTWTTRLIRVQEVPAGSGVSYGYTFVTTRRSVIGTLPVGYADGLSRRLSNVGEVLIHGQRAPLVGTICMDACMVDLTHIAQAQTGDTVVLLGSQGDERITVEEMAGRCGCITYEIFCAISQRVPRRYV